MLPSTFHQDLQSHHSLLIRLVYKTELKLLIKWTKMQPNRTECDLAFEIELNCLRMNGEPRSIIVCVKMHVSDSCSAELKILMYL